MQVMIKVPWNSIEEYIQQEAHRQVRAPERCPHCKWLHTLEHLGYYQRGCTDSEGKVREISVRRFECSKCAVTVSCLPDLAQPYRLVNSGTIQKFFGGDRKSVDVQRNQTNLLRYWRQFKVWAKHLRGTVGSTLGRAPPGEPAAGLWRRILAKYHSLASATRRLVAEFKTTCFCQYLCHQPAMQAT